MMIPIIPPEQVATTSSYIKKDKKEKGIGKGKIFSAEEEEGVLTHIVGEIIGEEGVFEGKEEEILQRLLEEVKKEEKKRAIKRKQIERKEKAAIHVGPLVPRFITAEKDHIHEKSILPTEDVCCNKLCKDLNDEIFSKEESLGAVTPIFVKGVPPMYKGLFSIPYAVEALKDYRYLLNNNNICKCYEETEEIEAPLPVIEGEPAKLISAKTRKPITLSPGISRFELPKTLIHIAHRKDKPTIPTHNGCCTDACNILTKKISKMENMLDKIELRGGKALRPMLGRDPRYEALAYKTFALQEYRSKLTKKNICECLKQ